MAEETNSILMDPPAMTEEQKKLVSVVAGMENDGIPEEVIKEKIPGLKKELKKDKEKEIFFGAILPEVDIKEPKDTKIAKEDLKKDEDEVVAKGNKYYNGLGVPLDHVYAYVWWNIAASSGNETASKNRDIVAEEMTPHLLKFAQIVARECVRKKYKGC